MAEVKFYIKKKTNPAHIYTRFMAFDYDLWSGTKLLVDPKQWNPKLHRLKKSRFAPENELINQKLEKLSSDLITAYTLSQTSGDCIDKDWLEEKIKISFNRPKNEILNQTEKKDIYFVDFMRWWLNEKMGDYRNPTNREKIKPRRQSYFANFVDKVEKYEKNHNVRIKLSDLTLETSEKIMEFFENNLNYGPEMIKKLVLRYNFFCERAIELNKQLPRNYKCIYQPKNKKQVLEPYLNETEIKKLFDLDLTNSDRLDGARDNFIIGLWTGLRVSDFLRRLDINNISEEYIQIKTQKTGKDVAIPIHPMIRKILNKRFGLLPPKISDQKFNKYIKELCKLAGFNERIEGYLFNAKTKRKEFGVYPKYKLVSSHICRRSLATNLLGKVPNSVIMAVCGWSTETMMYKYMKKTSLESAKQLGEYYKQQEQLKNKIDE